MAQLTRQAPIKGTNEFVVATLASASQAQGTAAYTYDRLESMNLSGWHTTGNFVVDLVSKEDQETLDTHLNSLLVRNPISEIEQTYIDGQTAVYKDAANDTYLMAFIAYAGEVNNKIAVHYGLGVYTGDTGNRSYAANTLGGTTIQVSAVEANVTLTIPSTLLNTEIVTVAADLTLNAGVGSAVTYLTKA